MGIQTTASPSLVSSELSAKLPRPSLASIQTARRPVECRRWWRRLWRHKNHLDREDKAKREGGGDNKKENRRHTNIQLSIIIVWLNDDFTRNSLGNGRGIVNAVLKIEWIILIIIINKKGKIVKSSRAWEAYQRELGTRACLCVHFPLCASMCVNVWVHPVAPFFCVLLSTTSRHYKNALENRTKQKQQKGWGSFAFAPKELMDLQE